METALAKRKPIYGVVKSVESNSVGRGNGITAPSSSSQRNVILSALNSARVQPSEITYIEGHGTGTKLGDRIELSALRSVFDNCRQNETNLAIGSVKSVFGHLDSAAGLLGVFKTLASLNAKKIPPTAHFKSPHPEIVNSRLEVPNKTVEWHPSSSTHSRIAGVSSFGLTGTNCHAIIAEAPNTNTDNVEETIIQRSYYLLVAGSSLDQLTQQLLLHKMHTKQSILKSGISTIPRLCLTVAKRLKEITKFNNNMKFRLVISAHNPTQMLEVLEICANVSDLSAMKQLARLRRDVEFCCPLHDKINSASPDVASFLQHGTVNVDGLFYGESQTIQPSPEVTLVIYNQSRHWLDPSEKNEGSAFNIDVVELLGTKLGETRELIRSLPLRPADDLQEKLASFCSAIIIKLFLSTPLKDYLINGNKITFNHAFSLSTMMPKYEKLFFVMIRELWQNNLLEAKGSDETIHSLDSIVFKCSDCLDVDASVIAEDAIKLYPSWADCFRFPLYCSQHLEKVVRGNMSPLSVIYPRGDLNFMFQFDKLGDLTGEVYYNMYMQLIASYAKQLSRLGKHVRILEVGAGVGHVTRQILPKLKDIPKMEYWFTDLGKAFVDHARTTFSDYLHMMKFSTFDITKSAPKQGLFGSFDIIVSYNVIHTTESIMESLLNLKSCLSDEGKLFIIESAKNETWATLAWGILDGWWYFKDYDLRPFEPMLEPEKWEKVLKSAGFQSVVTCPSQSDEREHVEKFLFLCSEKPTSEKNLDLVSCLGWWKTDIDRFGPLKNLDELQNEIDSDDSNKNAAQYKVLEGERNVYEELKKIWSDLLGEDNIQPEDDFNSLGGESLLAIQMMNLVKKRIGFQLEIADTFGYPTLGTLARFITKELHIDTKVEDGFSSGSPVVSDVSFKGEGTLLMFPGQGSQKVGMCVTLKDSKEARDVFQLAEEVLGYSILDVILGDEVTLKQKLKSTEFVQVALFVGCLAKIEQLKVEKPEILANVTHVAGLSVGEFAALVYAGVVNFNDALRIVAERGKAMETIVRETPTGMVSVFGPKREQLETFLQENYPGLKITTYLADNQHTVGGKDQECDAFVESLSQDYEEKMDFIDVRKLRVAGAFHSHYMDQASEGVNKMIMRTAFIEPKVPIIMNVSGDIATDPLEMKKLLCQQLTAAVKWKQSVLTAYELGVRSFVEVAPARVLSSIVKNRIKHCQLCHVKYIQF